ncbi:MAG: GH3 auxin-responsive promoter family protein [Bacteroidetes bacterium]|nr:GH3 auxin-responsive promoter family protein [Bacteroidota bacterium]
MSIINSIASWVLKKQMHQIELFMKYPNEVQNECLLKLTHTARNTEWGKKYDFKSIQSYSDFSSRIPLQDYESLKNDIERTRRGEQNILWPTEIKWFAKSSGTTSDKSKFIPVSQESLEECHYKGGKDMVALFCNNHSNTELFTGKNLALGGSHKTDKYGDYESYHGDLSAIVIQNLPMWAEFLRAPDITIALMDEWEEKLEKLARTTMFENVTSIAGVPSWMLVLLKHILKISGKKNIKEVWPNLEVFFHGGINFTPYREQFKELFGSSNVSFLELYNASEGFFGIQDKLNSEELLLMLDYGIFYEFIPMEYFETDSKKTIPLSEVELNKNYAMVISSTSGLWRYMIGDTVQFTSTYPYRFKISGRTKHFINAFGEEVIIDNAEKALAIACEKTNAIITEYTAGPIYMDNSTTGAHEWYIEFEKHPDNLNYFTEMLDNALKSINSDYEAKRYNNMALKMPTVKTVPTNTFHNWLKSKNKLGGQNKVPRLSNDRKYLEELNKFTC